MSYLDFKPASCKNCYKCLRECPVKAIRITNHQAKIIDERCILCGTCTGVCPQNAKIVHSESEIVENLLKSGDKIVASVAPSFVSSFGISEFSVMQIALGKLGFFYSEETAIGANLVVEEYKKLLKEGKYKNFITSACPAVNNLIQEYYPNALPYLANVDSPMLAHAKLLKKQFPTAKIVFIGPCIAKKKEAAQSGIVDAVLTYEDLKGLFEKNKINLTQTAKLSVSNKGVGENKAKFFPISRGIIKSFDELPLGYEYVAIDGVQKCMDILESVDTLNGMFLELNACDYACVKGPCSLTSAEGAIKANADIRKYATKGGDKWLAVDGKGIDISQFYPRIKPLGNAFTEKDIKAVLAQTGKFKKEDELNCGACGYRTCREKAWAVLNGFAESDMCVPYMRERAETMSYEIIQNSPNGIIVVDFDLKIIEVSKKARELFGISGDVKGRDLVDFINPTEYLLASTGKKFFTHERLTIGEKIVELSVIVLSEQKVMFGMYTDITEQTNADKKLEKMRLDTIATTDEVIQKQMRVAQEIASLLGETTAESKVALLKLKAALLETHED
ncbi:MAG: [Fe-Fe] hydrogenase large subunit C-terminal domain-containing protein [Eubacteriales bacterium]|nr:[Fe-Fe] hydrogenase large subunit C-terminal domain-containing protein [Eubacteriales bacterium]